MNSDYIKRIIINKISQQYSECRKFITNKFLTKYIKWYLNWIYPYYFECAE